MKTVPLHGPRAAGRVALVDDEDYDLVMQYAWFIYEPVRRGERRKPYAIANLPREHGQHRTISMHRLVTACRWSIVDHENHDGLDNRRHNLRDGTHNNRNRLPLPATSSQYKGVSWVKSRERWQARIRLDGRQRHLGYFTDEAEAARAYDAAARTHYAEYAVLNFK